jgi:ribosomal protein L37AE/L43A
MSTFYPNSAVVKYIQYFGNESSEELLESYGVETNKDKKQLLADALRPKQCPNCSESNIPVSKLCAKCRIALTYDSYSETLETEKQKEMNWQLWKSNLAACSLKYNR